MAEIKICAIYNSWDDWDLLQHSLKNIRPLVDATFVVFSKFSNFGEFATGPDGSAEELELGSPVWFRQKEPINGGDVRQNETMKRNYGLDLVREFQSAYGFTHFLMLDSDEMYDPEEFNREKKRFIDNPDLAGLVCRVKCYFRSPTLTIGYDTTLVPFIHKITPTLKFEFNRNYPFAWTSQDGKPFTDKKQIRIDPTRSMNISSGVEWSDITMHHYSWVRSDIKKKIRNSTAKDNIERSSIVADYLNAKPGYFCQFYNKILVEAPNVFGLPEIIYSDVKDLPKDPKG